MTSSCQHQITTDSITLSTFHFLLFFPFNNNNNAEIPLSHPWGGGGRWIEGGEDFPVRTDDSYSY